MSIRNGRSTRWDDRSLCESYKFSVDVLRIACDDQARSWDDMQARWARASDALSSQGCEGVEGIRVVVIHDWLLSVVQ